MDAALLLAALASRAGDRVDLLAVDRRVRARVIGAGRGELLAALTDAMAVLDAELTEPDYGVMASAVLGAARQRCLVVLLTDLNPAAVAEGLLPRIALLTSRYRLLIGAVADPRVSEMAAGARRRRGGLRGGGGRAGAGRAGPHLRCSSGAAAWTSSMPRRTGCRPRWPTPTCA